MKDAFRPMTEHETKVAAILRKRLADVDTFAYEGPFIQYDDIAVEIVRMLAADAAFKLLVG